MLCTDLWLLGGSDVKEPTCHAGDMGLIPGLGRSPREGNDYPLQYSCLGNPMVRGAWQATVHGFAKSQTRLNEHTHWLVCTDLCLPEVTRLRLLVGSFRQYVAVFCGSGLLLPVSQEELVKYEPSVAPVLFQPPSLFLAGIWVIWATGVLLSLLLCWRSESLFPRDVKEESKNSWWFFYEWSFMALNM